MEYFNSREEGILDGIPPVFLAFLGRFVLFALKRVYIDHFSPFYMNLGDWV